MMNMVIRRVYEKTVEDKKSKSLLMLIQVKFLISDDAAIQLKK